MMIQINGKIKTITGSKHLKMEKNIKTEREIQTIKMKIIRVTRPVMIREAKAMAMAIPASGMNILRIRRKKTIPTGIRTAIQAAQTINSALTH
jgi:hypothetical protein